jgi:hypothetical protein
MADSITVSATDLTGGTIAADSIAVTPIGATTLQTAPMEPSGGDERTFSQDEVNRIVADRLKRAKSTPPADYDELKAKAARLDELEAANKSDLEKANDAATKAKAQADEWKAKFDALQAEQERMATITQMAAQYKVDAGTLSRMSGDVEENAKYLADLEAKRPKYPGITDNGGNSSSPQTLEEALKGAKTFQEQIWVRAEWNKQHNK